MSTEMTKRNSDCCEAQPLTQPNQPATRPVFTPAVDLVETADEYRLHADVPGVSAAGVDIQFEQNTLTIHARLAPREIKCDRVLAHEYGVGDFRRSFRVGEGIDSAQIRAKLEQGVLTVHLPKSASLKPRRIAVNAE